MTTTMKKRTRAEAKKLMWEYYRENRLNLPVRIQTFRDEILARLIQGCDVIEAFNRPMPPCEKTKPKQILYTSR